MRKIPERIILTSFILLLVAWAVFIVITIAKADVGSLSSFSFSVGSSGGGGGSYLLEETWDGVQSCLSTDSCDSSGWTTSASDRVNADATAPAVSYFSGEALRVTSVGWNGSQVYHTFTTNSEVYVRVAVSIADIGDLGHYIAVVWDSSRTNQVIGAKLYTETTPDARLVLFVNNTEVDTKWITDTETFLLEMYANNTAGTWEWRVNGVSEGSGANDPTYDAGEIMVGPDWGGDYDLYFDNVAVSTSGWIGAP